VQQCETQFGFFFQDFLAMLQFYFNHPGVGAQEGRRSGDQAAIPRRKIKGDMMAFKPPAPIAVFGRGAENTKVIVERIAPGIAVRQCMVIILNKLEHLFQFHDLPGLVIGLLAQGCP